MAARNLCCIHRYSGRCIADLYAYSKIDGSIFGAAAVVNIKTSPARAYGMKNQHRKKQDFDQQHEQYSHSADISMNSQKLEEVTSLKYLGATLCKDGTCSEEIHIRIASGMAAMARFNRIWQSNTISFASKLHKSLVTSILLYGCEKRTLLADSEKDPGFRNHVPNSISPHLLLGAQDQQLSVESV